MKQEPTRLADDLRRRLEGEILAGELSPGDRLDETKLAARFSVSRTPVREALQQLATAKLVELRPRQGAVVAAVTVQELLQMFEVMAELEALCAGLAARRMTPDERQQLEESHRRCAAIAKEGNVDAYYEENRVFHETLYAGAHNEFLENMTSNTRNRLSPYRRFQLHHPGRIRKSLEEHASVVEAVLAGESEEATKRMRGHVSIQGDVFSDLVSSLPPSYVQVPVERARTG
ncbi:GntR family transcriptional regulator [Pelagibius sp. Alg239-R121]|uniref:GntR family transcriptional regulator n=1 Tax=Pelagibius sp. Alg239-R121 TaxID=2993448 RepID=UPI0024A6E50F|nr:GntR family transcriptional regulator [Pelagibius sp. Alg239-R121]